MKSAARGSGERSNGSGKVEKVRVRRGLSMSGALQTEIEDLLRHPTFLATQYQVHHNIRKSDHLLRSAQWAYWLAGVFRANRRVCARAGLLHDLHSRLGTLATHGKIAASVAVEMGEDEAVRSAIVPHMFPLGPAPNTREGWVLVLADKIATAADVSSFVASVVSGKGLRQLRMLRASDPFLRSRDRRQLAQVAQS